MTRRAEPIVRGRDVMSTRIVSIDGMATAREAAARMREERVHSLLVNKRSPADAWGIVSVQDIINGVLIAGLRLPPFMATLATMLAAKGAALRLSENRAVPVDWASDFTKLGTNKIANILPWTMLIALIVVVIAWMIVEQADDRLSTSMPCAIRPP